MSKLADTSSKLHIRGTPSYGPLGAGARIVFGISECRFGRLLVACTAHGLCAIALGAADQELIDALVERYPAASLVRDDQAVIEVTTSLCNHLQDGTPLQEFTLDIAGTPFQRRIWNLLTTIAPGTTLTYGELAVLAGRPNACRAVGQACGANPVAIVVPCHRVVRKNGDLGGFRWVAWRKAALLEWEKSIAVSQ